MRRWNTVETAESLGFCLNNQILLFMWCKLLHTATSHVQKLNDWKDSEWQANELKWECEEELYVDGTLFTWWHLWHHYGTLLGCFSFFFFLNEVQWSCPNYREVMKDKGGLCFSLLSVRWCWQLEKQSHLLFQSLVFTGQRTITVLHDLTKAGPHTHTQ